MELLEKLVAEDDLEDTTDELEEGHVTVGEACRHRHVRHGHETAYSLAKEV